MEIGDRIIVDGMTGTVVAVIDEGKFSSDYPASEWGYLKIGFLVFTVEGGLIHYPDSNEVQITRISN